MKIDVHAADTTHMIRLILNGNAGDDELTRIAINSEAEARLIVDQVVHQEIDWIEHIMKGNDNSMVGLSFDNLVQHVQFRKQKCIMSMGYDLAEPKTTNPYGWIEKYLNNDNVQYAPQEVELASYLSGQIDSTLSESDLKDFSI